MATEAVWWAGTFLGDGPWPANGETLLALRHTEAGSQADSLVVSVRSAPHPCGGEATQLRGPVDPQPFLLIRGLSLRVGPVTTVFDGYAFVEPGDSLALELNGTSYWLTATAIPDTVQSLTYRGYRLHVADGERTQLLLERAYVADGPPVLRWAGDLDRDGRLDLLFDFRENYVPENRTLLLSGRAGPAELVTVYASRTHPGC